MNPPTTWTMSPGAEDTPGRAGGWGETIRAVSEVRYYLGDLRNLHEKPSGGRRLRLAIFPAGGRGLASSRLRALPLLGLLEEGSIRAGRGQRRLLRAPPDLAWFQKKLTRAHLRIAHRVKRWGGKVVYDCDDTGPDLDRKADPLLLKEMLLLADLVTVDTPERQRHVLELEPSSGVWVLENGADYSEHLQPGDPPPAKHRRGGLRVLWFGYNENLGSLAEYGGVLETVEGLRLVCCGPGASGVRKALGGLPTEARRWSLNGFIDVLRSCDVTLLSHSGPPHHSQKSAHKMVTSICHGVPALVSDTPDYGRVAALAGIRNEAVFASPTELRMLLNRMKSPEARQGYISRARPILLDRYGPGTFLAAAELLLNRLRSATEEGR